MIRDGWPAAVLVIVVLFFVACVVGVLDVLFDTQEELDRDGN